MISYYYKYYLFDINALICTSVEKELKLATAYAFLCLQIQQMKWR